MTAIRPDTDIVRKAVALTIHAPSVDNAQPWYRRAGSRSVHLYADWSRQERESDPDERDLMLSCGVALHHLRLALATPGCSAAVRRMLDPADPAHLAVVDLQAPEPSGEDSTLAVAIPRRRSDRRRMPPWPVPVGCLLEIADRVRREGAWAVPVVEPSARFRLSRAVAQAQDDTFEPQTALVVIATPEDDVLSRLRAGEATSAARLTATLLGLATCPQSQPLENGDNRRVVRDDVLDTSGDG